MAQLATDTSRVYGVDISDTISVPIAGSVVVYVGSAVGDNGSGFGRQLVAADPFLGFLAFNRCDNTGSSTAGFISGTVIQSGELTCSVTGISTANCIGTEVYLSSGNDFTTTSSSNSACGRITQWISGSNVKIRFEGVQRRSL